MESLTNDEINRVIAEQLGWTGIRWDSEYHIGDGYPPEGFFPPPNHQKSEGRWYIPAFATDLNAAVGLLEGKRWALDVWRHGEYSCTLEYGSNNHAEADTPALAICIAFLKSKGVEA